jgi:signal transduction histidine kinase
MSPAMIFVVPTVMAVMLAIASGAAYRHTRRPYLLWWTGVWVVSIVYYLAIMSLVLAGQNQADPFSQFGLMTTLLGWLRGASYWAGARVFVGRQLGRQFSLGVVGVSLILLLLVVGTPFGQQSPATATRLTFVVWFFIAAAELLRQRPRTAVGSLCAASLLLLGIQGSVASQMSLDLTGALTSGWISTALSTALGLGVLGRTLEEEREVASARSVELGAANALLAQTNSQLAEANARLAELDQLKTDFVSMVSHELRTPLGLIKGYAGTLLRQEISLDEATRREFLVVIDDETDRLTELVTNLLDMSRIEAGTLRIDPRPIDVRALLRECVKRLAAREPDRVPDLDVPDVLARVLADERRIVQVVDNLLTNAARYTPPDTLILLRARSDDHLVTVAVVDHGPGIPAEKREQIFEKFTRLDGGERPESSGTGLGLAICRGIVQAHGGRIWVDSEIGSGSTFAFTLPVSAGQADEVGV